MAGHGHVQTIQRLVRENLSGLRGILLPASTMHWLCWPIHPLCWRIHLLCWRMHLLCWRMHLAIQTIHKPAKNFYRQVNHVRELLNRLGEQVISLTWQVSWSKTCGMLLCLGRFLQRLAMVVPKMAVRLASSRLIMFSGPPRAMAPMLSPGWAAMDKRSVNHSLALDAHPCRIIPLSRDIPAFLQPNRVIGAKTCTESAFTPELSCNFAGYNVVVYSAIVQNNSLLAEK
jgi:hypothetical protein